MVVVRVLVALVIAWYLLRGLALFVPPVARLVARLSRWTGRLHGWVLTAPATFAYTAIFTASTLLQRNVPPRLITLLTTLQSTNINRLSVKPLVVLATSALWVADRGVGLLGYLALYGIVIAWAERRWGTPRLVLIGLCGHVFGSLLTVVVELHAIRSGAAPASLARSTDVGVSYIMVAGTAAAILVMRGWLRVAGGIGLAVGVVAPVVVHHTVWDLGHLLATLCGLVAAFLLLAVRPLRTPVRVDRVAALLVPSEPPRRRRHEDRKDAEPVVTAER